MGNAGRFDKAYTRWIPTSRGTTRTGGGGNGGGNGGPPPDTGGGGNGGGGSSPPGGGGPKLTSATATKTGSSTASLSVSTNGQNGTLYWVVSTSSTAPTKAQVKGGQMHTGAAAADSGSQAVSGNGVQNITGGADGLAGSTVYYAHFMHERANGSQSGVATSASFTTDSAAPTLTYRTHAESSSALTTYTFAAQAIGTASADRHVIVGICGTAGTRTVSSVTIGGVTASHVVTQQNGASTASIYFANVPSGTTADVVVTWSAGQNSCGIGVWTATALSSSTAHDTAGALNNTGSTSTDLNLDLDTLADGVMVVIGLHLNAPGTGSVTWLPAAITGRYLAVMQASVPHYGGSGVTSGSTMDIRAGFTINAGNTHSPMVAASWR